MPRFDTDENAELDFDSDVPAFYEFEDEDDAPRFGFMLEISLGL